MARLPRLFVEGMTQHVIVRSKDYGNVFFEEEDYFFYLSCMEDAADRYQCTIHAYVLMPNHIHLLATPQTKQSLPRTLQSIGRRYALYFNLAFDRTGSLWASRYKSTVIDAKRYLLTCMRYIELNPVRLKLVKHPKDYPWSSYRYNALGEQSRLLTPHKLYRKLGRRIIARQAAYRSLFKTRIAKADIEAIIEATNKGWALGDDKFKDLLQTLTDRRVKPLPRGRPRLKKRRDGFTEPRSNVMQVVGRAKGPDSLRGNA